MKKMNSNVFLSFVITLMSIAGCSNADIRQKNDNKWMSYVTNCLDTLIEHGTDKYGTIHCPMLMAVIDVNTLQSPEKPRLCDSLVRCEGRLHRRGEAGSNPWYDQKTIGSMYLCSELTGDKKYAQAADAYLDYFMKHCCKENDLFIWGTHIYWNCYSDRAGGDGHGKGPHEILVLHPEWHEMYRLNPKAVKKEIDGIWQYHICNKQTGQHNRHDDGRSGCDFAFSGGSFSLAFAEMYHATKEKPYLDKAKMVANWHWRHRNAKTGLIPDAPSTGERYDAKHCFTCVTGPYVSQLLKCYELTGDKFFRDCAFSYVKAYEKYGWDDKAQTYHAMLKLDGRAIPEKAKGTDYDA